MRIWTSPVVLLAILAACHKAEPDAPAPPTRPENPTTPAVSAAPVPPATISDAAAQALVKRWLDVQNAGDFAAYQQLYAARFTGIKRAGEKTTRFDRAGWLHDRASMFERGFHVDAENVAVRSAGASVVVSFEQAFRSQKFADRGPKQLVLTSEAAEPRIAREEMLRSDLAARLSAKTISDQAFAFVHELNGRRFWFSHVSADGQTIDGAPELIEPGAAFGALPSARLPPALRALDGSRVVIDPGSAHSCEVTLSRWGVLAYFLPHFGDKNRWTGQAGAAPPDAQIAREVFGPNRVAGQDHYLVAEVTAGSEACAGSAVWARARELPDVKPIAVQALDAAQLATLRARIRKTPAYLEQQKLFREDQAQGFWDELSDGTLSGYQGQLGAQRFVLGSLYQAGECSAFFGQMTALWSAQGDAYTNMPTSLSESFRPVAALDLDGDGVPEWLSSTDLLVWDGKSYSVALSIKPSDYDCPC